LWIHIVYTRWNGKQVGHTSYIAKKSQLIELFERYDIKESDIVSFEAGGKFYSKEEIESWNLLIS
jgi:hypothetical protein